MNTVCPYGVLHTYTEQSARYKLQRHRDRGDLSMVMRACEDHWHVIPRPADEEEVR